MEQQIHPFAATSKEFISLVKTTPDFEVIVNTSSLQDCFKIEKRRGMWLGIFIPVGIVCFGYIPEWIEQWKFNRQDRKKDEAILQGILSPDQEKEEDSQEKQ